MADPVARIKLIFDNLDSEVRKLEARLRQINFNPIKFNARDAREFRSFINTVAQSSPQVDRATENINQLARSANRLGVALQKAAPGFRALSSTIRASNVALNQSVREQRRLTSVSEDLGRQTAITVRRFGGFLIVRDLIFGVGFAFKQAVVDAVQFEREIAKIAQLQNTTIDSARRLGEFIGNLAQEFGTAAEEFAGAAQTLAQAGRSATEIRSILQALGPASLTATFGDVEKSTGNLNALLGQFQINARDTTQVLDILNSVTKEFNVSIDELFEGTRRTGSVFATLAGVREGVQPGIDALKEFVALFTSVIDTSRESADVIGTAFRTILPRLQRRRTRNVLEELGVNLDDAEGNFVGPLRAIQEISRALQELGGRNPRFLQIAEELGGLRQIARIVPLLQEVEKQNRALAIANEAQGSVAEDAAKAQETLAVQLERVRERFNELVRDLVKTGTFENLANAFISAAEAAATLINALEPLLPLLGALGGVGLIRGGTQFLGGAFFDNAFRLNSPVRRNQGGLVSTLLTPGELVFGPNAVRREGATALEKVNRTGDFSGIKSLAGAALVPGTGNSDTVQKDLPPGSFVVKKSSVNKGLGFERFGGGGRVRRRFQTGGEVPASARQIGTVSQLGFSLIAAELEAFLTSFKGSLTDLNRTFVSVKRSGDQVQRTLDAFNRRGRDTLRLSGPSLGQGRLPPPNRSGPGVLFGGAAPGILALPSPRVAGAGEISQRPFIPQRGELIPTSAIPGRGPTIGGQLAIPFLGNDFSEAAIRRQQQALQSRLNIERLANDIAYPGGQARFVPNVFTGSSEQVDLDSRTINRREEARRRARNIARIRRRNNTLAGLNTALGSRFSNAQAVGVSALGLGAVTLGSQIGSDGSATRQATGAGVSAGGITALTALAFTTNPVTIAITALGAAAIAATGKFKAVEEQLEQETFTESVDKLSRAVSASAGNFTPGSLDALLRDPLERARGLSEVDGFSNRASIIFAGGIGASPTTRRRREQERRDEIQVGLRTEANQQLRDVAGSLTSQLASSLARDADISQFTQLDENREFQNPDAVRRRIARAISAQEAELIATQSNIPIERRGGETGLRSAAADILLEGILGEIRASNISLEFERLARSVSDIPDLFARIGASLNFVGQDIADFGVQANSILNRAALSSNVTFQSPRNIFSGNFAGLSQGTVFDQLTRVQQTFGLQGNTNFNLASNATLSRAFLQNNLRGAISRASATNGQETLRNFLADNLPDIVPSGRVRNLLEARLPSLRSADTSLAGLVGDPGALSSAIDDLTGELEPLTDAISKTVELERQFNDTLAPIINRRTQIELQNLNQRVGINQLQNRSEDLRRQILGQSPIGAGVARNRLNADVGVLTGGITDPRLIGARLRQLQAGPITEQTATEAAALTRALELLSSDTRVLDATMKEANQLEQAQRGSQSFINDILGGGPNAISRTNQALRDFEVLAAGGQLSGARTTEATSTIGRIAAGLTDEQVQQFFGLSRDEVQRSLQGINNRGFENRTGREDAALVRALTGNALGLGREGLANQAGSAIARQTAASQQLIGARAERIEELDAAIQAARENFAEGVRAAFENENIEALTNALNNFADSSVEMSLKADVNVNFQNANGVLQGIQEDLTGFVKKVIESEVGNALSKGPNIPLARDQ